MPVERCTSNAIRVGDVRGSICMMRFSAARVRGVANTKPVIAEVSSNSPAMPTMFDPVSPSNTLR